MITKRLLFLLPLHPQIIAKPAFSRAPSNFLMMGLDFMVTSDLSIRFIESNNYPLWPRGTDHLNSMMQQMGVGIIDTISTVSRHYCCLIPRAPSIVLLYTYVATHNDCTYKCLDHCMYERHHSTTSLLLHILLCCFALLQNDLFDLLFDCRRHPEQFQDMHPGDVYGTWTLIWNELYAQCSDDPPYDPCREFMP